MKHASVHIHPSVLAADFAHLADEVLRAERSGADALHIDIMDGHFVKNLSMGPRIVAAINRSTPLPLHVHLMMYNPFDYVEPFVEAGADLISFHFEATEDVEDTLLFIRRCGVKTGLAINPETSVSFLPRFFPLVDQLLIMSVHPGFGGQKFLPGSLDKIREAHQYVLSHPDRTIDIAVDGGITEETAQVCARAGANVFVAGTYFFSARDMAEAISSMRASVTQA